ncbi:SAM-dependent methyltransferase [Nostoc sp. NMS4]|uniref:class I SAM-dependent DNA methyltransferase n=1 Tax=Nostoc sp. NMS4 TaxID=2815390 RepID=UPI0025D73603|nr:SAM-dependent methyltransferase [Nostoc sp. NMS4]MBN3925993.1 methyltransferase domain-containing protein [Nostoc sp. NMS4]
MNWTTQKFETQKYEMNHIKRNLLSLWQQFIFEMTFSIKSDPWKSTSLYQQTKYQQTIDLLGCGQITQALELGCAEGYLTALLAPRVDKLIAADISQIALKRARACCSNQKLENINFLQLDMNHDLLPQSNDLIVCSEVLYYINGQKALQAVAQKLVDALNPGGYLLATHSLRVNQEPSRHRLDWLLPFGAIFIGEILASTYPLVLVREIRTPRYRIQLFQYASPTKVVSPFSLPEITELTQFQLPQCEDGVLDGFSLAFLYNQLVSLFNTRR